MSAGSDAETIPVVAVFFAVFGYLFVDTLKMFALPPIAAYSAMSLAALYCVSDFVDLDAPGNHQMIAVARLLVFVQAILMLQTKTRRIFEQLGVFCLLELIVAAVFNDAITFGVLLIPIAVIGALALSSLSALSAAQGMGLLDRLTRDESEIGMMRRSTPKPSTIRIKADPSVRSVASTSLRMPRLALLTLAPSVTMIAAIFFYALPRTTDATRVTSRGSALVGFNDEMRLEQIGDMLQSSQVAMRVYLKNRSDGKDYRVNNGLYLRGRVLEKYTANMSGRKNTATWSLLQSLGRARPGLPREFNPSRSVDRRFYDNVFVSVICESVRSETLFAVAPYHSASDTPELIHSFDRWTIARQSQNDRVYPRIAYQFGSHAFRNGVQTDLISRWSQDESMSPLATQTDTRDDWANQRQQSIEERQSEEYVDRLLDFDIESMPTAASIADRLALAPDGSRLSDFAIAKELERYLAASNEFNYSLSLNAESIPGVDPIEQFLSVDRSGHCQYFASALAMMLRSQGIPARVVVGYYTDEYNELGQHYVARQLHAHAWVEALIGRDQLSVTRRSIYGQPPSSQYWLRLDPTPTASRADDSASGVVQMLDVAQNMWDDYVIDMDAGRQNNALGVGGVDPINGSYARMIDWLSSTISRIRAGNLGGGSLATRQLFSWPAAILGVCLAIAFALAFRVRVPVWVRHRLRRKRERQVSQPTIDFYAETLRQLSRVGLHRRRSQTPAELARDAAGRLEHPSVPPVDGPLNVLTSSFYRQRFGGADRRGGLENVESIEHARPGESIDRALSELRRSIDLMLVDVQKADRGK